MKGENMDVVLTRGERFKDERVVHNPHGKQTTKQVSEATGVAMASINALENDDNTQGVSYLSVLKLANYYGVSVDYLLCLRNDRTPNAEIQDVIDYMGYSQETIENLRNPPTPLVGYNRITDKDGEPLGGETAYQSTTLLRI